MVADVVMFNSDEAIFGSQYFSCPVTDESIPMIKILAKEQKWDFIFSYEQYIYILLQFVVLNNFALFSIFRHCWGKTHKTKSQWFSTKVNLETVVSYICKIPSIFVLQNSTLSVGFWLFSCEVIIVVE